MKVIQLVTQMEAGGAQKVAHLLTEGLRERGHDAQLWFLYRKTEAYEESSYVRSLLPTKPLLGECAKLSLRLWKELRTQKPDAIITHTHSANSFAAPIAALAQVPVRLAVHHNPIETYSLLMRVADRCAFAAGCYSSMVTVSKGVRDSFSDHQKTYQKHLHLIYNATALAGSDTDFDPRGQYSIPSGMKLLVNVGRLTAQKNQSVLLHLLQHIPDGFLLLVGTGDLRRELFTEAIALNVADRVQFTGEISPECVAAILRKADLFLLSSMYESFCLAAVEAMYCGVPVIASDLPCLREVLGDSQLFFPINNVKDLARKVQYLLAHKEECVQMGLAGRLQADLYTVKRMVDGYESLLIDALHSRRPYASAPNNLCRREALGSITRVHDHL